MKHFLNLRYNMPASRIKVVTVMPCYDKKLEAVRPNFTLSGEGTDGDEIKEVDTVLATHELVDFINQLQVKEGQEPRNENFSKIPLFEYKNEDLLLYEGLNENASDFLRVMKLFVDTA